MSQRSCYKKCISGVGPLLVLFYMETAISVPLTSVLLGHCGNMVPVTSLCSSQLSCLDAAGYLAPPPHPVWSLTMQGQSLTQPISYKGKLRPPNFAKVKTGAMSQTTHAASKSTYVSVALCGRGRTITHSITSQGAGSLLLNIKYLSSILLCSVCIPCPHARCNGSFL